MLFSASNPSNCQSRKYRDSRNCFFSMFSPASITRTCTVGSALHRCHPPMPSSSLHTYERSAIVVRGFTSPMKAWERGIGRTYSSSSLPRPQPPPPLMSLLVAWHPIAFLCGIMTRIMLLACAFMEHTSFSTTLNPMLPAVNEPQHFVLSLRALTVCGRVGKATMSTVLRDTDNSAGHIGPPKSILDAE